MPKTEPPRTRPLESLSGVEGASLLAYLNLPPVGAYADADAVPLVGEDAGYEVGAELRAAIGERRAQLGGLGDLRDIADLVSGERVAELTTRLASTDGRYGNRVRATWGGPESSKELFALIESAEHHIHIEMYILGGELGLRLAQALSRKAQQGVEVRVMFTASGFVMSGAPSGGGLVSSFSEARSWWVNDRYVRKLIIDTMRQGGVEVVDSSPIGSHWRRSTFRKKGVRTAKQYYAWCRQQGFPDAWIDEQSVIDKIVGRSVPYVDHRKMIIVDGKRAFTGSMNLADSYFYDNELSADPAVNRRRWQWHDNGVLVEGPAVAKMNALFAPRFALSGGSFFDPHDSAYAPKGEAVGSAIITQVATGPGLVTVPMSKNWKRLLMTLIGFDRRPVTEGNNPIRDRIENLPSLAQNELIVEHCYPSDAELLMSWGKQIRERADELKCTLVFPSHYDTAVLGMECDRFFPELIEAGADVFGYDKAIMHSKIAVADEFYVAAGSFNLTIHSARMALEYEIFVQDRDFGAQVKERIEGDLEESSRAAPTSMDRFRSRRSIPVIDALLRFLFF